MASENQSSDDRTRQAVEPRPVRVIPKKELLKRVGLSFPTIWKLMRAGRFPRARDMCGKPMWVESEIDQFLAALPFRPYKGEVPQAQTETDPSPRTGVERTKIDGDQ